MNMMTADWIALLVADTIAILCINLARQNYKAWSKSLRFISGLLFVLLIRHRLLLELSTIGIIVIDAFIIIGTAFLAYVTNRLSRK